MFEKQEMQPARLGEDKMAEGSRYNRPILSISDFVCDEKS